MVPGQAISATPVEGSFLDPDADDFELLESLELGGVALNDGTQGREVQVWRAWVDGAQIKVSPISGSPVTVLVSGLGLVSSVSLAFDSNMQPVLAYVENEVQKLRWYNVITSSFQTDTFAEAYSGKLATDDKRASQVAASDVLFAYLRDDVVYWRTQRDRYLVERTVGPAFGLLLNRFGMTTANRVEWELTEAGANA